MAQYAIMLEPIDQFGAARSDTAGEQPAQASVKFKLTKALMSEQQLEFSETLLIKEPRRATY